MRLPVVDDAGKIRWASVPDDCAGEMERPTGLDAIIKARANFVLAVLSVVVGSKIKKHLRQSVGLRPSDMLRLSNTGYGSERQLRALETAFQNARDRVRLAGK